MKGLLHHLLGLSALAVLAASCANLPVTVVRPAIIRSHVGLDLVDNVAKYGGLTTIVLGNPFGGSDGQFGVIVTETIRQANFGQDLNFTTTPLPDDRSPYRLIILFNPAPKARPEKICVDLNQPTAPRQDSLSVMMVLCTSEYPVVSTTGRRGGVSGTDDPGFRSLLRSTTAELLPSKLYDINSPEHRRRS